MMEVLPNSVIANESLQLSLMCGSVILKDHKIMPHSFNVTDHSVGGGSGQCTRHLLAQIQL